MSEPTMPPDYRPIQPLLTDAPVSMDFLQLVAAQRLFERYAIPRHGVIHLGAHLGQEISLYLSLGFRKIVLVEPQPREFSALMTRVASMNDYMSRLDSFIGEAGEPARIVGVRCAVAEREGTATFYRLGASLLSSLLPPDPRLIARQWSEFKYFVPWYKRSVAWLMFRRSLRVEEVSVPTKTLDQLVAELDTGWQPRELNYLRMNILGGELNALRGAEGMLEHVQMVQLKVDFAERYKGNPSREDFDAFLGQRGFACVLAYSFGTMGHLVYVSGDARARAPGGA